MLRKATSIICLAIPSPVDFGVRRALLCEVKHACEHVVAARRLSATKNTPHVEGLIEDIGLPAGHKLHPRPPVGGGEKLFDALCETCITWEEEQSLQQPGGITCIGCTPGSITVWGCQEEIASDSFQKGCRDPLAVRSFREREIGEMQVNSSCCCQTGLKL